MGSEVTEAEAGHPLTSGSAVPQLSLFSASPIMSIKSPSSEPSGMLTPPLQGAGAAVPFRWEEEPGKPRACTCNNNIARALSHSQLELPPRLFQYQGSVKLTSPTTVLEGPYMKKRPKASSFRIPTPTYGFFTPSPDRSIVLSKRWLWKKQRHSRKQKASWLFGGLKSMGTKLDFKSKIRSEAVLYKDSDGDDEEEEDYWISNNDKFTRTGSFAILSQSQTKSQFWASIYGGLKQMIPWKAKKLKKTGIAN